MASVVLLVVISGAVTNIGRVGGKSILLTMLLDWCSFGASGL